YGSRESTLSSVRSHAYVRDHGRRRWNADAENSDRHCAHLHLAGWTTRLRIVSLSTQKAPALSPRPQDPLRVQPPGFFVKHPKRTNPPQSPRECPSKLARVDLSVASEVSPTPAP